MLLDNEIAFNESIIEERDQGIHEIQQQIGEVNEIFKDLAVLVHEQGTVIGKLVTQVNNCMSPLILKLNLGADDINANIENSHAATAQARSDLGKAAKNQRSNSSLVVFSCHPRNSHLYISETHIWNIDKNPSFSPYAGVFAFDDIRCCSCRCDHITCGLSKRIVRVYRHSIVSSQLGDPPNFRNCSIRFF